MALEWFVQRGNREEGPYSSSRLKQLADEEQITPETLVKLGEQGDWTAADTIEDLFSGRAQQRAPQASPAPTPSGSRQPAAESSPPAPQAAAETDDAASQWYMQGEDGQQYGPTTRGQLDEWVAQGRVTAANLLWQQGWDQWQPAATVYPQLAGGGTAPEPKAPAAAAQPASRKPRRAPSRAPSSTAGQASPAAQAQPQPSLSAGRRLGRFEILEYLGRDRMGEIYKALQPTLDRLVAIRVLPGSQDADFVKRFRNEIRAAAALNHPNIVEIYDIGQEEGVTYIAMELVKGNSLAAVLRSRGRLDVSTAMFALRQAAGGLATAHAQGVVHRDLTPSSILLGPKGLVKLRDFGLVDFVPAVSGAATSAYTPPEVLAGEPPDSRSDLYALGATFYHLLSGQPPAQAPAQAGGPPQVQPLEQVSPGVPQSLSKLIDRLLATEPAGRCPGATELLGELDRVRVPQAVRRAGAAARQTESPATDGSADDSRPRLARAVLVGGLVAVAAIVLLLVVLVLGRGCSRAAPSESPSESGVPPAEEGPAAADPAKPAAGLPSPAPQ